MSDRDLLLGVDLGGSGIKVAVLESGDPHRVVHSGESETHAEEGPPAVLDRMATAAREAVEATGRVRSVGIVAPGPLDLESGCSLWMPNLPGWDHVPIVAEMEHRLELPVALLNDARAFTLAELRLGAGRGFRDVVGLTLGTGVGGGIVVDGSLLLGMNGTVGEIGHQTIVADGPACPCGNNGCLERYVCSSAIAEAGGLATAADVVAAALAGEARAAKALERAGGYLGIGIANAVLAVGPERVIVGGGVAEAGELLLAPARRELVRRNRVMPVDRIEVVQAELGTLAGAIGAALWAARAGW